MKFFNLKKIYLWIFNFLSKMVMVLNFFIYCINKLFGIWYMFDNIELNEIFNYFLLY